MIRSMVWAALFVCKVEKTRCHVSAAVTAVSQFLADEAQKVVSTSAPQVAPMPVATDLFSPSAFETPRTPEQVLAIVAPFLAPQGGMPGMPNTGGGFAASIGGDRSTLR